MRSFVIWAAPVSRTSQRNVEGHTNFLPACGPLQATHIKPGAPLWASAGPVPASIFIGIRSLSLPEWRGEELAGLLRPRTKVSQLYLGLHAFGLPFVSVECCATVALLCKIPFPVLLMGSFDLKWRETKWRELTFTVGKSQDLVFTCLFSLRLFEPFLWAVFSATLGSPVLQDRHINPVQSWPLEMCFLPSNVNIKKKKSLVSCMMHACRIFS